MDKNKLSWLLVIVLSICFPLFTFCLKDFLSIFKSAKSSVTKQEVISEKPLTTSIAIEPRIIDTPQYIMYIPSNINSQNKHPLVIALHPGACANCMVDIWKGVSEKHKWIILASKEFRNGIGPKAIFDNLDFVARQSFVDFAVDQEKIIATGLSGGGMGAHMFCFDHPDLISIVVSNVGVIHRSYVSGEDADNYPRGKLAVFLASPADFNYNGMKQDQEFLEGLDWKTKWIEFEGGHTTAPPLAYEEAAQWIQEQLEQK